MTSGSSLANMAERLAQVLKLRNEKLVTAESCTGGGLAAVLTQIPGSSQWFERGYVTYSNAAKRECLGVSLETLETSGAVSEETATEMAQGAIAYSHAQAGVAITGIAGPDGGTVDKPVGTVCFAWAHADGSYRSTKTLFQGDRQEVRQQACMLALQGLLDLLES